MNEADQPEQPDGPQSFQPGETISPQGTQPAAPQALAPDPAPAAPLPAAVTMAEPVPQADPLVTESRPPAASPADDITWTASEFIAHSKTTSWYLTLAGAAVVAALLVRLLTKDTISTIVVLIAAIAFGFYAARQPRELEYRIDGSGLTIDRRHFDYRQFRAFAIMPPEGAFSSITLTPLRRFAPLTVIYYDPNDEEKIVALLSDRLPMEDRKHDIIDRLMWRIRF